MPRSGEKARERLQRAALALFGERGYDQATTAEIAERAGVTERTFFRHFADKREVLFDGQAVLLEKLTAAVADAPATLRPLETLRRAFHSVEKLLEDNRPFAVPRQRVIDAAPALRERELAKLEALAAALATALRRRGVDEAPAALAAQAGMAVFRHAVASWFADPAGGLAAHLDRAFDELGGLAASLPKGNARRRR